MEQAELALDAVVARAKMAIVGVPEETRDILDDGSSAYSRPLPGAARMYPETDVKPTLVGAEKLDRIKSNLPETIEEKLQRFVKDYGLNPAHAEQLVRTGYEVKFDDWAKKYCMPHVIAKTLLNIIPELSRSDDAEIDQNKISDEMLEAIFSSVKTGKFTKEGIGLVLKHMVKHNVDVDDAIASLQLDKLQRGDIEKVIDALLVEPEVQALISQKGKGALGALMGITMRKLRGKADGKVVNEILSLKLTQYLQKS
jgi:glutamyl-tRNA(Gln) amidotransferase subunit E